MDKPQEKKYQNKKIALKVGYIMKCRKLLKNKQANKMKCRKLLRNKQTNKMW